MQCNFRHFRILPQESHEINPTDLTLLKKNDALWYPTDPNLSKWLLISLLHGFTVKVDRRKDTSMAGNEGARGYYQETIIVVAVGTNWC